MPVIEDNEIYKLVAYKNRDGTEIAQVFYKVPVTKEQIEKIVEFIVLKSSGEND